MMNQKISLNLFVEAGNAFAASDPLVVVDLSTFT